MKTEESKALCKMGETALDTNVNTEPAALKEPEKPKEEKKKKEFFLKKLTKKQIIVIGSVLGAIVLVLAVLGIINGSPSRSGGIFGKGAEDVVSEYISAVENGDAEAVVRLHHSAVGCSAEELQLRDEFYLLFEGEKTEGYEIVAEYRPGDYFGGSDEYYYEYYSDNFGIEVTDIKVIRADVAVAHSEDISYYFDTNSDGDVCAGFMVYKAGGTWYIDTVTDVE